MEKEKEEFKLVELKDVGVVVMKNGLIVDRIITMESMMFNPNYFRRKYARSGEDFKNIINNISGPDNVIYCSVSFEDPSKTYYYQTDDDTIQIGDRVIVTVWPEDNEVMAYVQNVQYFDKKEVPFPLHKTKHIIRKASDDNNLFLSFQKLMLYNKRSPIESTIIIALLSPERLMIIGQEFGYDPFFSFGEGLSECFYTFGKDDMNHLLSTLSSDKKKIKAKFLEMFGGKNGCQELAKFCTENRIEYTFSVEY